MAETTNKAAKNPMEIMESFYAPKISGEDSHIFVGLNGKSWLIPRGKTVQIPKPVADILRQQQDYQQIASEYAETAHKMMDVIQGI